MKYTLRQIQVFLAIAKYQNTSLAAEKLFISQSAVSAALQTLESNYQIKLFDRKGKKLYLNALGRSIRKKAEALLAHARDFDTQLEDHENLGNIKIGASYTIANHLVVNYLGDYLTEFPQADIQFSVANSPEIVDQVLNYEVDIGMIEGEFVHRDIELIPWISDELVIFCSPKHPLADNGIITDKDIVNNQWIMREPESGARQSYNKTFSKLLPNIDIYFEFKHNEAIKKAVEQNLGLGYLSHVVLQNNFREGSLVPLRLASQQIMQRMLYIVLPRNGYRSRSVIQWLKYTISDTINSN